LTTNYDGRILGFTHDWISTNKLIRKVHGNKTLILKAIKDLEAIDYLESRKVKNTKEYKRIDDAQTETEFNKMMKDTFEWNQKQELDRIDTTVSITKGSGIKLTKEGEELLDHIQSEIDRAYMVIIRTKYQVQLEILPNNIAQPRIRWLKQHIANIMDSLKEHYPKEAIREYFQNHTKKLEFKI